MPATSGFVGLRRLKSRRRASIGSRGLATSLSRVSVGRVVGLAVLIADQRRKNGFDDFAMLKFSRKNPFPLLRYDDKSITDARVRAHSDQVDAFLGLQIEKVEKKLRIHGCRIKASIAHEKLQELWIGLAAKRFLTPYTEIRTILSLLKPKHGCTIVDLGSAYGRMGFVIERHYPKIKFIGYEYVGERVKESKRCLKRYGHPLVRIKHADLSSMEFRPITADYYFIYDYGTQEAIKKTLVDLKKIAREKSITVVARGRDSRDVIEEHHPWLIKIVIPKRHIHFSIYRSTENFSQ